jgi:hypothetical protein
MTLRYAVGIKIKNKTDQMTVEAEDALIAALKVKTAHPEAAITYVRKQNVRGDRRHPHASQIDKKPAGHATRQAARWRAAFQSDGGMPFHCPNFRSSIAPIDPGSSLPCQPAVPRAGALTRAVQTDSLISVPSRPVSCLPLAANGR